MTKVFQNLTMFICIVLNGGRYARKFKFAFITNTEMILFLDMLQIILLFWPCTRIAWKMFTFHFRSSIHTSTNKTAIHVKRDIIVEGILIVQLIVLPILDGVFLKCLYFIVWELKKNFIDDCSFNFWIWVPLTQRHQFILFS